MRHILTSMLLIALVVMGVAGNVSAIEIKSGEDTLNVNGRLQLLAALEGVDDPWKDSDRVFMFLQQARLSLNGTLKDCDYNVTWMLGGEEIPERNSVMSLLDAYVNVPLLEDTLEIKAGQLKVPYGRERLQNSGALFNSDRSIHNNFFNIGRDVGGAIHTRQGVFTAAAGVFTGGGINIPERYIPEDLESPMFVLRAGVNNGLDKDVFTPFETKRDGGVKFAAFLNGMYTGDSRVGHSTPLRVKYYDKSLMIDGNWNPYIDASGEKAEYSQFGADAAVQMGLTDSVDLLLSAEANVAEFNNGAGDLKSSGGVLSASLIAGDWVFGIRYAVVDPDEEMAYTSKDAETGEVTLYQIAPEVIQEITPSIVYYMRDYNVKIVADLSYQIDVPVSLETGHGVYNLMRQPDQVSYATSGGIELQDNYLASLMLQYDF